MKPSTLTLALSSALLACACTATPTPADTGADSSASPKKPAGGITTLSWEFQETRIGEYDQPFSNVTLKLSGSENRTVLVGEFTGTCAEQDKAAIGAEGDDVIIAARCWWAGAGEDFLVRRKTEGELRIEHRSVDEGSPDEPAAVLPFTPVGEPVRIPTDAVIR